MIAIEHWNEGMPVTRSDFLTPRTCAISFKLRVRKQSISVLLLSRCLTRVFSLTSILQLSAAANVLSLGSFKLSGTGSSATDKLSLAAANMAYAAQVRRRVPSSNNDDDISSPTTPPSRLARFINFPGRRMQEQHNDDMIMDNFDDKCTIRKTPVLMSDDTQTLVPSESQSSLYSSSQTNTLLESGSSMPLAVYKEPLLRSTQASPSLQSHTPVPAHVAFSRKAASIHLPDLDRYLESLPRPNFSSIQIYGVGKQAGMFIPLDKLAASGKSVEDLETNSTVSPSWRNRETIFSFLAGKFNTVLGSSLVANYYSLQGLFNTVQIFALLLSSIVPRADLEEEWRELLLGTIPNILALNFASTLTQSIILLSILMTLSLLLLYYFYRTTSRILRNSVAEGLVTIESKASQWSLMICTLFLTTVYLPLSTLVAHVLVWSDDLWVVPNPYANETSYPPMVSSLGPPDEYLDPLDFCWTTTMKKDEINFAPLIVVFSLLAFTTLTVWFPIYLRKVIKAAAPTVDPYTELGRSRSKSDMDREYQRLLSRDRNPVQFLYSYYRREWATYEAFYLFMKLSTLLIITVISPDNCLFRTLQNAHLPVVREIVVVVAMTTFFVLQCIWTPFDDPVDNASEWISRLNYVLTALVSLAVAADIPGQSIIDGPVLYVIYIVTYGLSIYFTFIDYSWVHRLVKRLTHRIDFSIDIFSPRIDVSPTSIHARRRIWQESITVLFLTSSKCAIPEEQPMVFAQAPDSEYPPYLLGFLGSVGERHVENLKILREIGSPAYNKAVALLTGPDYAWFKYLQEDIQKHYIGPDSYWKNPHQNPPAGCTNFFGNAWWIPFPPTLVIRYDDGRLAVLNGISDLQAYVAQNSSSDIRRRREIRLSLRALDGKTVYWPYDYIQPIGIYEHLCCGRSYKAQNVTHYEYGVFHLASRGLMTWMNTQLGSGFDIQLTYAKNVKVGRDVLGLNDDYDLTIPLARFLTLNQGAIPQALEHLSSVLSNYREHCRKESIAKSRVLTYRFLAFTYDHPKEPAGFAESSIEFEHDMRVCQLMLGSEAVFQTAYTRFSVITSSEAATWWYIFWDDLWRRNYDTISALALHATDFSPYYPTSIAYSPVPRAALEMFLAQRGLLSKTNRQNDFFHPGFLNKVYVRLNDIVFQGTDEALVLHHGDGLSELDMEEIDLQTQGRPSTLGTGGGTDHDDVSIRARPRYKWESLFEDQIYHGNVTKRRRRWFAKMGAWFGITPLWKSSIPSRGIALDIRLENGQYVRIRQPPVVETARVLGKDH